MGGKEKPSPTEITADQFRTFLDSFGIADKTCTECGKNDWTYMVDHETNPVSVIAFYTRDSLDKGALLYYKLHCTTCGYTKPYLKIYVLERLREIGEA